MGYLPKSILKDTVKVKGDIEKFRERGIIVDVRSAEALVSGFVRIAGYEYPVFDQKVPRLPKSW